MHFKSVLFVFFRSSRILPENEYAFFVLVLLSTLKATVNAQRVVAYVGFTKPVLRWLTAYNQAKR